MYRRTGQLVTIGVILFCAALLPSVGRAPQHAVAAVSLPLRWVELGPGGRLIVRTVDREGGPQLRVAGRAINLTVRARPSSEFPITVCEAMLPSGIGSSSHGLPLLTGPARRIVVVGDTGCRIEAGRVQPCNDPDAWPWARIAAQAAAWHPDLIIHVGDLLYREEPCPSNNTGCAGSP